jgi:hypothetical protein
MSGSLKDGQWHGGWYEAAGLAGGRIRRNARHRCEIAAIQVGTCAYVQLSAARAACTFAMRGSSSCLEPHPASVSALLQGLRMTGPAKPRWGHPGIAKGQAAFTGSHRDQVSLAQRRPPKTRRVRRRRCGEKVFRLTSCAGSLAHTVLLDRAAASFRAARLRSTFTSARQPQCACR